MDTVKNELQRLEQQGVISPVVTSEWAAPIVVVKKADGQIRICGDFSTGLNSALNSHQYPIALPEAIFATLAGGTIFSQLDMAEAYLQMEVEESSRHYITINTHRGLFRYNRLPFGIKSAPGIFQQCMDTMLSGLTGAVAYLDDIIVMGTSEKDHKQNLFNVLKRIQNFGFKLKINKCKFSLSEIKYLGLVIDRHGRRPDPNKVKAIREMPAPKDESTLRSFLCGINYYGTFIKNMSTIRAPLDELLKKDVKWNWSPQCQQAFQKAKDILSSDLILTHYDPNKQLVVATDATSYAIGGLVMYRFNDGTQKAISHASRTLTNTERSYSQIEKEALALVFAVQKFHQYIYGRKFILQSDHKPLISIFGSKKGIPVYTANRIQRWAIIFLAYNFKIEYISTNCFGYADMLSRLINENVNTDEGHVIACIKTEASLIQMINNAMSSLPINFNMVKETTQNDPLLQTIISYILNEWPNQKKLSNDEKQIL